MNAKIIRRFLSEAVKGPSHIVYCWKNIHLFRDHCPNLYRKFHELDLGEISSLSKLHVILRTTDSVMNLSSSRKLADIGIVDKLDVIRKGGVTLFRAARKFIDRYGAKSLKITLIADRLSSVGLALYTEAAQESQVEFEVVAADGSGNGPTFQSQINTALPDNDDTVELILEDDYMLDEDALAVPFEMLRLHNKVS